MKEQHHLAQALAFIDATLHRAPDLSEIAAATGLSAYHFARLFSTVMGESPVAYVRRRRLARAALKLVEEPETRLIDLALDSGFESQEAFTRAFRRTLGMTPGELKRRGGADHIPAEDRILLNEVSCHLSMAPQPERLPPIRIAGLSGRFDRVSDSAIPALWDRFVPRLPLPGQIDPATFGVCSSSNWREGSFDYTAGVSVAADAILPWDIAVIDVPAQTYLVFSHAFEGGAIHQQILAATMQIWLQHLPASGHTPSSGPDFERYPPGFHPDKPATITHWLPIHDER